MRKRNNGFLLAFPALAGFLVFYFVPFLITVWYSVSFGIGKREFVGLDNFKSLFENEMFLLAVKNTIHGRDCSRDAGRSHVSFHTVAKCGKGRAVLSVVLSVSDDSADCVSRSWRAVFMGRVRYLE